MVTETRTTWLFYTFRGSAGNTKPPQGPRGLLERFSEQAEQTCKCYTAPLGPCVRIGGGREKGAMAESSRWVCTWQSGRRDVDGGEVNSSNQTAKKHSANPPPGGTCNASGNRASVLLWRLHTHADWVHVFAAGRQCLDADERRSSAEFGCARRSLSGASAEPPIAQTGGLRRQWHRDRVEEVVAKRKASVCLHADAVLCLCFALSQCCVGKKKKVTEDASEEAPGPGAERRGRAGGRRSAQKLIMLLKYQDLLDIGMRPHAGSGDRGGLPGKCHLHTLVWTDNLEVTDGLVFVRVAVLQWNRKPTQNCPLWYSKSCCKHLTARLDCWDKVMLLCFLGCTS